MVRDDHDVSHLEFLVHTSGGIADEEYFHTEFAHDAYRECHLLHVITLVVVEAALHSHDVLASEVSEYQFAGMAFNGRNREVRNIVIVQFVLYFNMVHEVAKTCAENNCNLRNFTDLFAHEVGGLFDHFQISLFH